jgi:hypothetical protein
LATIAAMPPGASDRLVASLSPDLAQTLGNAVRFGSPSDLPAPPDTATLGAILARLDPVDRNAIVSALPAEQQQAAVAAAAHAVVVGSVESGFVAMCP